MRIITWPRLGTNINGVGGDTNILSTISKRGNDICNLLQLQVVGVVVFHVLRDPEDNRARQIISIKKIK
jgi:hypothetical protein